MFFLNRATILGNATRDPETRQIPSGQSVCSFAVATNRSWVDAAGARQEKAEFHNIVAWGKLAELCSQMVTKGKKIYVEGRLQTRDWEGQDGVKRYRTEIVAENIIFVDYRQGGNFSPTAPTIDEPAVDPTTEIRVEDIPF